MSTSKQKTESARAGRSKASHSSDLPQLPESGASVANTVSSTDVELLQGMLNSLKDDICGKIDSLATELRGEISSVQKEMRNALEPLLQKVSSHDQTIRELESACTEHSDQLTGLESAVNVLKGQVSLLMDKCEDLEGRSRRNNIRLVGLQEGLEAHRPTVFVAQLLKDLLNMDEVPLLDRAHRTLRARPKEGDAPRPLVIRVHFSHVRNEILRRASEISRASPLNYQGKRIYIFADYTTSVAKKRAAFSPVKRQLRTCPGVKFGLLFPAVFKITLPDGTTNTFDSPDTALDFVNASIKK